MKMTVFFAFLQHSQTRNAWVSSASNRPGIVILETQIHF